MGFLKEIQKSIFHPRQMEINEPSGRFEMAAGKKMIKAPKVQI